MWTRCTDALPQKTGEYLTYSTATLDCAITCYYVGLARSYWNCPENEPVTHWMVLPKAPADSQHAALP